MARTLMVRISAYCSEHTNMTSYQSACSRPTVHRTCFFREQRDTGHDRPSGAILIISGSIQSGLSSIFVISRGERRLTITAIKCYILRIESTVKIIKKEIMNVHKINKYMGQVCLLIKRIASKAFALRNNPITSLE